MYNMYSYNKTITIITKSRCIVAERNQWHKFNITEVASLCTKLLWLRVFIVTKVTNSEDCLSSKKVREGSMEGFVPIATASPLIGNFLER